MTTSLQERSRSAFIPLRDAVLCLDCHFITPPGNNVCSVCGGRMLVGVAQILDALLEETCGDDPSKLEAQSGCGLHLTDSNPARLPPSRLG
jgi:hypothetical protein